MNRYFRDRFLIPVGIPIAVLIGVGFFIVNLSRVLLAVNKHLSVVVAIVVAVLILAGAAFAANAKRISRTTLVSLLVILALAIGTSGALAAKHGERRAEKVKTSPPSTAPKAQPSTASPTSSSGGGPAGPSVNAGPDFAFHPGTLTVKAGTTVTWDWVGGIPHTVTSSPGDPASFDSGIKQGGSFTFTFATPGTYHYYCTLHGSASGAGMFGTITVT